MAPRCSNCRFGHKIGRTTTRCLWISGAQDDRMPEWAHRIIAKNPHAVGRNDRAETCPAYAEKEKAAA